MQFEDQTKKYEIVFHGIRNKGSGSRPLFKFIMEKPVQVESFFEKSDIRNQQRKTGIIFYGGGRVPEAFKTKKDVLISIPQEAIDFIRKTHEEELNKVKEEAKKDPETWRWWTGCDTGNLYISPNTELGWEFREDLEEIKDIIEKVHKFHAYELFGKESEKSLVPHEVILKLYNDIIDEMEQKATEKKAKKEAKETPIFAKARGTGEPQILESYSVECTDHHEECDVDNVIIYAMPDGTTKREQYHTW